ncbi:MAG: nicotinate-nucleotide adenylyltransferase [Alphaproteobacteria bacterium]|nr:nicotinate-nucleotide adenylyltransferase [Alphaproteobacteria bacterium]
MGPRNQTRRPEIPPGRRGIRRFTGAALAGRRIGVLGGSFNPAHEGHLHITRLALTRLALDQVWWMVSPQNPLKSTGDMAPFADRMASAQRLAAGDNRIVVTDIETRLNTRYTTDTLRALRTTFPRTHFIWLMGADNLLQIPRWENWATIFEMVPIAVFDRATYSFGALASKAAHRFRRHRLAAREAAAAIMKRPPAWIYFHTPRHPASSTELRARERPGGGGGRKRQRKAESPLGT